MAPLVDRFGRPHDYLRVSLTDRCGFRCRYCMPDEGVEWTPQDQLMTTDEILHLCRLFVRLGIKRIRLTGGEPTLRRDYMDIVHELSGLVPVQITTNGTTLVRDALALADAGLAGVNVSCDSLQRDRFADITQRDALPEVMAGIAAAQSAGLMVKVNAVVIRGFNDDEVGDFVRFAVERGIEVRFIEFMPFLGNNWKADSVVPAREIRESAHRAAALTPLPGTPSDVATDFAVEGSRAVVGFISSVTESFCSGCNRIRLTAEGKVKTCLFLPPRTSLRDLLRQGADESDIVQSIRDDLSTKWEGHPSMKSWTQRDNLSMVQIGG